MALFKNMSITNKGMALYAKAQAGQQINFTKLQVGSGQIDTQNPVTLLGLLNPKLDVPITSITANPELKSATIVGNITNKNVTESMYICELGIFAQDPDEGEILYGYVSAGGYGDYYAPESQGPYSWQYEINAAIGNAANVTAELSQLQWDYGVMNSNPDFIYLEGGNQKEINKSIDNKFEQVNSQLEGMVKKEQIYGNKTEIVGMNVSGEYSSYGSYGIIFKPKQTINLKTVDIDTNKTQTVKVALTEWYDDLSREIKEGEALFTKELSLKQGLNKYTLDFLIPNDGKTYFLYTIGQMEDTKRHDFAPPINAYVDFIKGGRAVPDDSTKKRQVINKWYWFFNWEIETSIEQNLNKLFTFADNGKKNWVDVIGSPLLNTDSFSTLKSKTQTLKNTMASNLSSKKVSASGTENLSNLIDKIKSIDTGFKFATGEISFPDNKEVTELSFKPLIVYLSGTNYYKGKQYPLFYMHVDDRLVSDKMAYNNWYVRSFYSGSTSEPIMQKNGIWIKNNGFQAYNINIFGEDAKLTWIALGSDNYVFR
ncbi:hypothetical protein K144316041_20290 [Clostridium tetani]|uniref:hypothetical protein n=1 Tax=Clostridium tetani TaxID=1513 RepID=UPI0029538273|nr:hypothetical protein [Clostridium tetani]BDR73321.1 hypothetical protein K144316041_20290 [Clostridium tetani]